MYRVRNVLAFNWTELKKRICAARLGRKHSESIALKNILNIIAFFLKFHVKRENLILFCISATDNWNKHRFLVFSSLSPLFFIKSLFSSMTTLLQDSLTKKIHQFCPPEGCSCQLSHHLLDSVGSSSFRRRSVFRHPWENTEKLQTETLL